MKKNGQNNFFSNIPPKMTGEIVEDILTTGSVRIERIISHGDSLPENFWYDQDENEWVIVLQGQAKLLIDGEIEPVTLDSGDYINIPKHVKHQVIWTTPKIATIWLGVFYGD